MATVVILTFLFLICKVQSQIYGPYGPGIYPGAYGLDPGLCAPTDIYGPIDRIGYGDLSGIPGQPNIGPIAPCALPAPCPYQSILNTIPAPSLIQNPIYPISQPLLPPIAPCSQQILPLPQVAPSIITNPVLQCAAAPVVTTVVDNTLANSLANAIQLLIVSNLIENTLGSSCGDYESNNLAQALGFLDVPCVNNYEVVCPDFYPTPQVLGIDYPVIDPCINDIPCYQDPIVYPSTCLDVSPCSPCFGPSIPVIAGDYSNSYGFNGYNQVSFDSSLNPFGSPFGCEPAVATIAPMAVEVPFPASIPANLICNFGYLPNNVPCVSVNVDPLPCNNFVGNFGGYGF